MMNNQRITIGLALLVVCFSLTACATKTGTGAMVGGLGAALLTGNTSDALTGAAVGAGVGYLTEEEERKKREQEAQEKEALANSRITDDPATAADPEASNPLTGTTWRVLSLKGDSSFVDFKQIILSFQTNTKATTMYTLNNGDSDAYVETYGVVGDKLVLSGTEDGNDYTLVMEYTINGNLMTASAADLEVVLEQVEQ